MNDPTPDARIPAAAPLARPTLPPPPWRAGVEAARKNLVPGAVLSVFAVGLLLAYWYVPAVNAGLTRLGEWKLAAGWPFVVIGTAAFGGLIPGLVQRARPRLRHTMPWKLLVFLTVFWAYKGLEVDLFYRLQAWMFGHGTDPATVVKKIAFDMGVYAPFWAVPTTALPYLWSEAAFSRSGSVGGACTKVLGPIRKLGIRRWYARDLLPVLISNWAVWVPAVCVIYCLPLALQLPVQNLVLCFWSLLLVLQVRPGEELPGDAV